VAIHERERFGELGHVDFGEEPELAQVHAEHRGALLVSQPHGAQHRAVSAEADDEVGTAPEFLGADGDSGAAEPLDLRVDAEDLDGSLLGPVEDGGHRLGGVAFGMQDYADGMHVSRPLVGRRAKIAMPRSSRITGAGASPGVRLRGLRRGRR
jgi:hypothetical protein